MANIENADMIEAACEAQAERPFHTFIGNDVCRMCGRTLTEIRATEADCDRLINRRPKVSPSW